MDNAATSHPKPSRRRLWILRSIVSVVLIAAIIAAIQFRDDVPLYGIFFFCLFIAAQMFIWPTIGRHIIAFNVSFLALAISLGEFGLWYKSHNSMGGYQIEYSDSFQTDDDELGYAIRKKNVAVKAAKKNDLEHTLYDVTYEIDERGFRSTPAVGNRGTIFFFGGSFTFGEGVNNSETLPAQTADLTGFLTVNFGLNGYGTHQVLRSLEINRPESLGVTATPDLVVYTFINDHINRAAGGAYWDRQGPSYEVGADGLQFQGPFHTDAELKAQKAQDSESRTFKGPYILTLLREQFGSAEKAVVEDKESNDLERVLAMIERASQLAHENYQAELLVVIWDAQPGGASEIVVQNARILNERLREIGVPIILTSELDPLLVEWNSYIEHDWHPKPEAYEIVARAIAEYVENNVQPVE